MRRIVAIGTVLTALICAGAAYAALNSYTAAISVNGKAGSAKAPVPVAFTENYAAANATSGDRAAPLTNITTKIYGLISNAKAFPTCSAKTIDALPKYDAACPKGSRIATGRVNALLGGPDLSQPGAPCNPDLHVYNGGAGKQWYFFTTSPTASCGSLTTGATPPYPGYVKRQGKYLVIDVPLPSYISTAVANHPNLYGSLIKEVLSFPKMTKKVKGKTVGLTSSVGCLKGKRPWTVSYTATNGSTKETKVVKGSAKC